MAIMKIFRAALAPLVIALTIALLFVAHPKIARSQLSSTGAGCAVSCGQVAAAYVGPGDVAGWSGFAAWYSCARAYNAAYAAGTGNACDLVDTATGAASCTLKLKINGFADLTSALCVGNTVSVTTFCTVTHAAGCSVTKMYDQTGNAIPVSMATLANMPTLNLSALNSRACPVFTKANLSVLSSSGTSLVISQPLSASMVAIHTGGSGAAADTLFDSNLNGILTFFSGTSANTLTTFAGGANQSVTVTDGAYHAIQDVWDDANSLSAIYSDGVNTAQNGIGTGAFGGDIVVGAANTSVAFPYSGTICEMGFIALSPNSTQKAAMNSNQHGTNGYNF